MFYAKYLEQPEMTINKTFCNLAARAQMPCTASKPGTESVYRKTDIRS